METEKQAPKTKVVKLSREYSWGSETITEITVNQPKGKHLRALPAEPRLHDLLELASKCSGISSKLVDELDGPDAIELSKAVGELL